MFRGAAENSLPILHSRNRSSNNLGIEWLGQTKCRKIKEPVGRLQNRNGPNLCFFDEGIHAKKTRSTE